MQILQKFAQLSQMTQLYRIMRKIKKRWPCAKRKSTKHANQLKPNLRNAILNSHKRIG